MLKFLLPRREGTGTATSKGFSLIELITVVVIVGILAAIVSPSYISFLNTMRMNNAQSRVFSSIKKAQSEARKLKRPHRMYIRVSPTTNRIQTAILPMSDAGTFRTDIDNGNIDNLSWEDIPDSSDLWVGTTQASDIHSKGSQRYICIGFNGDGTIHLGVGCINLHNRFIIIKPQRSGSKKVRCIRISTILGSISMFREGEADGCKDPGEANTL
ncbi:MAG: Tfp pilus assembly protein FimT/FimU [Pseudanabaenaceae cyanobacterium]